MSSVCGLFSLLSQTIIVWVIFFLIVVDFFLIGGIESILFELFHGLLLLERRRHVCTERMRLVPSSASSCDPVRPKPELRTPSRAPMWKGGAGAALRSPHQQEVDLMQPGLNPGALTCDVSTWCCNG